MREVELTVGGALIVKKIGDMQAVVFLESDLSGKQGSFYPFINLARIPVGDAVGAIGDDPTLEPLWRLATDADSDTINLGAQLEISIDLDGNVTAEPSVIDDPSVLLINLPPGVRLSSDFAALFILQLIQDEEIPVDPDQADTQEAKRQIGSIGKSVLSGAAKQGVPGAAQAQAKAEDAEAARAQEEAASGLGNGADADGNEIDPASSRRAKAAVAWIGSATLLTALGWGLLKK